MDCHTYYFANRLIVRNDGYYVYMDSTLAIKKFLQHALNDFLNCHSEGVQRPKNPPEHAEPLISGLPQICVANFRNDVKLSIKRHSEFISESLRTYNVSKQSFTHANLKIFQHAL